ncbi:MAG: NPCBM/NEW2 domain-containing protein [Thermoguttaceae bacterium]|jgi:hypothetical protein
MRYPSATRFLRLLICVSACLLALPATLHAGTVKVATNLSHMHYFAQQNTFANLLLNFLPSGGTLGVDLTEDGVSKRGGGSFFDYDPTAHLWPDSTDNPAAWYKLSYHCDAESGKNYVSVSGGFTVVKPPLNDGKGNWTAWLAFKESALRKSGNRVRLGINYAEDDLGKDGLAKHPISRIKLLYPGCTDDDFLSPVFKQRAGGYCRFRFCDPMNMNGRRVSCGLDVPGTSNTYEREGKGILRAVNAPGNVQTQTYGTPQQGWFHNMSWGKGPGAGNHMTVWTGKKYEEVSPGIGCMAPCELEYVLNERFFLFQARVGIDHEVDNASQTPHGSVTFQVWAATVAKPGPNDYKLLKEIKNLTSKSWETILVDVTGMARLKLKMLDNGDPNGHVDIHNPSLYFYQRWSDRTLPRCIGSDGQGTFREGLPYEYAMRICNDLNADIWINIPCTADNDYGAALKGSVCHDALMRNSHPAGDCNLDGKVTYADFKILAANFGGDGEKDKRWWSQGDFNNDQVVGLDDLKLLLMNTDLNAWTTAQRQELNAFLAAHPGPYVLGPDPKTRQGTWMLKTWRNHTKGLMLPVQEDSGGKPARFMVSAEPRHGRLDVSAFPTIRYAPNQDYLGIDDFIVVALDDHAAASNPIWIAVEVAASVDSDVIANYHCDENSGTTMIDTGGNKGELKNTVRWTAGESKGGLAFSWTLKGMVATPGYVKLGNSPAMEGTAYSFSLWVKPEEIPTVQSTGSPEGCVGIRAAAGLLVKPDWRLNCSGLFFKADEKESGKGRFVMRHSMWFSAPALEAVSPVTYAPGQWHHLVGVVAPKAQDLAAGQSAKSFGVVWLYVDGKLAQKTYFSGDGEMQNHMVNYYLDAVVPERKLNPNTIRDPPYVFTWKPARSGTYRLIAAATDDTDLVSASPPVTITVK